MFEFALNVSMRDIVFVHRRALDDVWESFSVVNALEMLVPYALVTNMQSLFPGCREKPRSSSLHHAYTSAPLIHASKSASYVFEKSLGTDLATGRTSYSLHCSCPYRHRLLLR